MKNINEYYNYDPKGSHQYTGWLGENADEEYDKAIDDGYLLFEVNIQDYWNGDGDHLVAFKTEEELVEAINEYNESDGAFENHWFIEDGDYTQINPNQITIEE